MQTPRFLALVLAATAVLAGCAKHSGGQTGDEDALPSGDDLFGELAKRQGFGNYEPASSVGELAARSERVVVGRPQALRAGRSFVSTSGDDGGAIHTVVLEVEVERTLKGPNDDALYLEFIVGASEAGAPSKPPNARVIVFAIAAGGSFFPDTRTEGEGRGLPSGHKLYRLTNPQGFGTSDDEGDVSAPFEPGDNLFAGGDLDEVIGWVEQALDPTGADASTPEGDAATANAGSSAAGRGGAGAGASAAGSGGGSAGTAAGDGGAPDIGCRGELPFGPGANPAPCPASCFAVRGLPFDLAAMCVDYGSGIVIGCLEGAAPPSISCVDRAADGRRFLVPSAWPFPMSTVYRPCSDADTATVVSAPMCQ